MSRTFLLSVLKFFLQVSFVMPKLTFTIVSEAASHDPKTTVPCVKSMRLVPGGLCYMFPPELQGRDLHQSIFGSNVGKMAKKAVAIRGTSVTVNINLSSEDYANYVDDDENPIFRETLLLPWTPPPSRSSEYSWSSPSTDQQP